MVIARVVAALALLVMLTVAAAPEGVRVDAAGCPPRDTRGAAGYPITGYWMNPRPDRCETRLVLSEMRRVGADTVITFGSRLTAVRADAAGRLLDARTGQADPALAGCLDGGRPCYLAARDAVPGKEIRRAFTYVAPEHFGPGLLRCPGLDRRIESGGRSYYRILLGASCTAGPFDLVLAVSDGDGIGNLLAEAAGHGMKVYPGLPAAPQDPAKPWLPHLAHLDVVNTFTRRVLDDYRHRHGASSALAGVYQSFELAMRDRADDDEVLALYRAQHAVAAAALPGRTIVVSPYWDARRGRGFPPAEAGEGFAEIAATRAGAPMAIAIQDGRGAGKVPVYGPDQAEAPVDPRLEPVVGAVTNRQAYLGSTRDYVEAAASRPVPGVELWVNVELFEPTPVAGECSRTDPLPLRGRASKARVDGQVMAVGGHAAKIIAYRWEPFVICRDDWDSPSLGESIAAAWNDPLIVRATRRGVAGREGIQVEGHNLAGGTLRISYRQPGGAATAAAGAAVDTVVTVVQERHTPAARPGGLETAWAPFTPAGLDPARPWITVTATNGAGRSSTNGHVFRG
ncbi:hypothetical protein FHU36_007551 [Nonomuraea muscovyensis]|uniref:Uncharacterized protein n=1 Tax=Nonomuraea muscovyensis TaxID=1124761 RepID=A0A7X0C9N2_9ACTN|nr:hypothetical protein [Nonomuraea muscovyensis]MBB6350979.1 hypothetical protein [Nonomuraea muscovyensis]